MLSSSGWLDAGQGFFSPRTRLPDQDIRSEKRAENRNYGLRVSGAGRNTRQHRVADDLSPIGMRQQSSGDIDEQREGEQNQCLRDLTVIAKNEYIPNDKRDCRYKEHSWQLHYVE